MVTVCVEVPVPETVIVTVEVAAAVPPVAVIVCVYVEVLSTVWVAVLV